LRKYQGILQSILHIITERLVYKERLSILRKILSVAII